MLKALYDYALQNDLALPPGFVKRAVRAYIHLSGDGKFLDLERTEGEMVLCPDMGSPAQGPDKCNPLAEKRSVVLPEAPTAKSRYFRRLLAEGGEQEPMLLCCLKALETLETTPAIMAELDRLKVKPPDYISFCVDGVPVLESGAVQAWWAQFRRQFQKVGEQSLCLITGEPTIPAATLSPIQGLYAVGGRGTGDRLICFDKSAFCSYGLKQAANAPVSEEAFAGVKAALDSLLQAAPILAGMKFVHWYDRPVPKEQDELFLFFGGEAQAEEETPEERAAAAKQARSQADALVDSLQTGGRAAALANEYFILLLSGADGRAMVRHYERGSYRALQRALSAWNEELRLLNDGGTAPIRPAKFTARLLRLLSYQKNEANPFRRLDKELAGLIPALIRAILSGGELPDAAASRALGYIRSKMMAAEEDGTPPVPDGLACQWLKVWLLRRERKKGMEELLTMGYRINHPNPAYHCGALMAVYGAVQRTAMPEVNAGVIDRYYCAASQTPALTLGQLQRLSTYHLGKIEAPAVREGYEKLLDQVFEAMGETIPVTLSLEEQAYFALGYRQMHSEMAKQRAERRAKRNEQRPQAAPEEEGGNEYGHSKPV